MKNVQIYKLESNPKLAAILKKEGLVAYTNIANINDEFTDCYVIDADGNLKYRNHRCELVTNNLMKGKVLILVKKPTTMTFKKPNVLKGVINDKDYVLLIHTNGAMRAGCQNITVDGSKKLYKELHKIFNKKTK